MMPSPPLPISVDTDLCDVIYTDLCDVIYTCKKCGAITTGIIKIEK